MKNFLAKNKGPVAGLTLVAIAAIAWLAFGFFGIHKAFLDDVVDEEGPAFDVATSPETPTTEAPATTTAPTEAEPTDTELGDAEPVDTDETDIEEPTTSSAPTTAAPATPGEVVTIASGNFSSLKNYSVTGDVQVLNNGTEQRFLRFENFESDNGPDLKVYLRADNGEFVDLGALSGNIGNQNYEIPVDVDLETFNSVEIWCERFSTGFGAATLSAT